jgi:hypothetical protein
MSDTVNQFLPEIAASLATIAASPAAQPVASYAVGTSYVPQDQLAMVHEGEMVVDAKSAELMREYGIGAAPASKASPTSREDRAVMRELLRVLQKSNEHSERLPARLASAIALARAPGQRGS